MERMMTERGAFDPGKYLMKVGKAEYLEVKWRLVWLRDVAPDAVLETEHIRIDSEAAIFKATVLLPSGAKATGYGNCNASEFADYIGKAETKALGRALAALGFGTQFTADFAEDGKIADAAVTRSSPAKREDTVASMTSTHVDDPAALLSGKAIFDLVKAAAANGWDRKTLETEARRRWQEADLQKLTAGQGAELLSWAQQPRSIAS